MCPNPNKLIDLKTHNPKLNTTHVYCIYLPSFTFGFPWSHGVSRNTYICENHHIIVVAIVVQNVGGLLGGFGLVKATDDTQYEMKFCASHE